jgi:serine phosphatase RsbU (regulator of sigma subunit)
MTATLKIWKISLLLLLGLCTFLYIIASTAIEAYFAIVDPLDSHVVFVLLIVGIISCYSLCLLGTFVFLKKIQDRTAKIFYLMLLFWALAMHNMMGLNQSFFKILAAGNNFIALPAWPLAVGALLHFYLIFPVVNPTFQKRPRLCLILIYAPIILFPVFVYSRIYQLNWADTILNYGWGIWLTAYFNLAMFVLHHAIRHAPNAYIKKQAQIMANGTVVSLSIPLMVYFIPSLFLNRILPYAEFSLLLLIFWPMTLAYVIIKHRFMDINVIIKRGASYAIVSGIVIAVYFLVVLGAGQLLLRLTGLQNQFMTISTTLLIALLFNPLKTRVQNFLDRRFYSSRFLQREAIRHFGHQLVNIVDFATLVEALKTFLVEKLQIRPVALFMHEENKPRWRVRLTSDAALLDLPEFKPADKIIKLLQTRQQLVDLSSLEEQIGEISADEKSRLKKLQAELVLPILSKKNLTGLLTLGSKENNEPYYEEDLELLATLGDQINISFENALLTEKLREQDRLKKELEVARRIQLSSLPQADPQIAGLEITGISIPALEVGGDYYDYLNFVDGRFGVVIGDVSGKGTSAALYMSQLKGMLQAGARHHHSLKDLVIEVNAITYQSFTAQSFITLMCGAFDVAARKLTLVRAGHLPLIHYSANEKICRQHLPKGLGLGLENGHLFKNELEEIDLSFSHGDVFIFYTDGISEAQDAQGNELETAWVEKIVQGNGYTSAVDLREKIMAQLQQLTTAESPRDDMTLIVVKVDE